MTTAAEQCVSERNWNQNVGGTIQTYEYDGHNGEEHNRTALLDGFHGKFCRFLGLRS